MAIKATMQGLLIYAAMAAYLLAFLACAVRWRRPGLALYALGFLAAAAAVAYRWQHVGHVPLQNLFEVMCFLGMLMPLVSLLCRRFLGVGGEAADMLIAAAVLFPAGFVFKADPQMLPPALQSRLFVPHVASYMAAYAILAKATVQAAALLLKGDRPGRGGLVGREEAAYRMICLGFPLLTLGLVLGAWWGKLAWGDYWNWDPKELWSLASWLAYAAYFHHRAVSAGGRPRLSAAFAVAGAAGILITLLWVNLSRLFAGLHAYAT